jgi:hypothetical protein
MYGLLEPRIFLSAEQLIVALYDMEYASHVRSA